MYFSKAGLSFMRTLLHFRKQVFSFLNTFSLLFAFLLEYFFVNSTHIFMKMIVKYEKNVLMYLNLFL